MTYAAFIYEDYRCHGIKGSFAGLYHSESDALTILRGSRYVLVNLEIMDLDTCGITKYRWIPLFNVREGEGNQNNESRKYLKHRWNKEPEFEITWDGDVRQYGPHQMHYEAGEWSDEE